MTSFNIKLASDLLLLVDRYPLHDWLGLARLLENKATRDQIIQLIRTMAEVGQVKQRRQGNPWTKATSGSSGKSRKLRTPEALDELILHLSPLSAGELRAIASKADILLPQKDSKQRSIGRIFDAVKQDPVKRKVVLDLIHKAQARETDYERWVNVIMRPSKNRQFRD